MEDFVTSEIVKKLKEKGYPLLKVRKQNGDPFIYDLPEEHPDWQNCDAYYIPTIYQVLKWLREKGIHIQSEICVSGWYCSIYTFSKDEKDLYDVNDMYLISGKIYDDYEQCTLAGIEYILDNLI